LAALLEPCEQIWRLFSNFDQIMAIEKLQNHLIFGSFLAIYSQQKKALK
jgi:hypothetical protein